MPGRGDRWINLLQSRSRLGLAGLSQFFLSVDSFLSLIDVRRRCGSRLSRAARERKAGCGQCNKQYRLDFHYPRYAISNVSGRMIRHPLFLLFPFEVVGHVSLYDRLLGTFPWDRPFAAIRIITGITAWIIGDNIISEILFAGVC